MTRQEHQERPLLRLGVRTYWGRIIAVGWIGERYYWIQSKCGSIWMLPARLVEP